jgi:ADP-dependent NAD(P)H-hydrate dehydratase
MRTHSIYIDRKEIFKRYKPMKHATNKGVQGHVLLIGGSYGKMGSICLSSKAALKTGCGLVTVFIPKCGYEILQISIPEVMTITDDHEKNISNIQFEIIPQAIGIGPGLGQEKETQNALHKLLKTNKIPLVIDADALNILSKNRDWISLLPPKTILTPHPKELERLLGYWNSEEQKMIMALDFALVNNVILVMKGAPTRITDGKTIFENSTGNAALATAGTGDVLTGMITSLLAQNYQPIDAALLGVYLHGLTSEIALFETGYESFIASDVISNLGKAFLTLHSKQ